MSFNGYTVIDTDSHIREYVDVDRTYRAYMDPDYRDAFEYLSQAVAKRRAAGRPTELFMHPEGIIETSDESRPLGVYDRFGVEREARPPSDRASYQIPREVHWEPQIRLDDMDKAMIDTSIMFSSRGPSFCVLRDVGFENALHRAYHRFMGEYCSEAEGRLRWVANASMRDIPATIEELKHCADRDPNLAGVLVPPSCPDGTLLDNPAIHPLYRCAEELDLPILVHGGVLRSPNSAGTTELNNSGFIIRAVYQPWAGMTAVSALIGGGVFDLFPKLRIGVFETTGGWMPWLIEQLDESYHARPHLAPNLKRLPSEVVAGGRLFHSFDAGERYIEHCVQELGEDMWLFATDYPHSGTPWPYGVKEVAERPGLSEGAKRKIFGENAQRLCPRLAG